ncbi:nucleotidyltransferase family protein [Candidatus Entotheonella palauensis]|nr:nucleotidyltransferase family protein [Candidatus Entotheonella palauensis]
MGVVGIVLAAGESRRMGKLKALLPFGGRTVIEQVIHNLLQVNLDGVAVVLGHRAPEIAAVLEPLPVRMVHNARYREGMTSSVQAALEQIVPIPEAYMLALVDQPHLGHEPAQHVLEAFTQTRQGLVIPTYQGKRGHPIVLSCKYRQEVLDLGPDQGLNLVTRGHPEDTLEVPLADEFILQDMDYPEDYEAVLKQWQQRMHAS